uniref:Uncharacterized protein n=1 Tax=Mycena chlorophos TaxID=658473 RepID=A0ABQ0L0C2_MYCCL|nr:predicted protein [Mycena chlorophos]
MKKEKLPRKPLRLSPLYLLTWLSISLSGVIFVSGILDLGLWMALSASLVTLLYHAAVLFLSARTPDLAPGTLITNFSTAGCAAILVFAWIAGFAMTLLALLVGRENFPGPPPLIQMTFPVHFMLVVLSGVELAVMGFDREVDVWTELHDEAVGAECAEGIERVSGMAKGPDVLPSPHYCAAAPSPFSYRMRTFRGSVVEQA